MVNRPEQDQNLVCMRINGTSGNAELERTIALQMLEAFELWKDRQRKYGSTNIAMFGEKGCVVRAFDKLARLKQAFFEAMGMNASDEKVYDSWLDLINYAVMGAVCHRGGWPGVEASDDGLPF
jgi:hypothetical protein